MLYPSERLTSGTYDSLFEYTLAMNIDSMEGWKENTCWRENIVLPDSTIIGIAINLVLANPMINCRFGHFVFSSYSL